MRDLIYIAITIAFFLIALSYVRANLLIYGLGGVIVPFVGIKIIDVLVHAIGLA